MHVRAETPLITILSLVHLKIDFLFLAFGPAGYSKHGGDDARSLLHRHPTYDEVVFGIFKDLLAEIMFVKQVGKVSIVVSSGTEMINTIPAKLCMVGTSMRASSMTESTSE